MTKFVLIVIVTIGSAGGIDIEFYDFATMDDCIQARAAISEVAGNFRQIQRWSKCVEVTAQ